MEDVTKSNPRFIRPPTVWWGGLLVLLLAIALFSAYRQTSIAVTIQVDGVAERLRTHRSNVGALLADLDLDLSPSDLIVPSPSTPLQADLLVEVTRTPRLSIQVDGVTREVATWSSTLGEALRDADLVLNPYDEVWLDDKQLSLDTPLAALRNRQSEGTMPRRAAPRRLMNQVSPSVSLVVRRAIPLHVRDQGHQYIIYTTAPTIGEALLREDIPIYLGDIVQPGLGSPLSTGMHVFIQRSTPIIIQTDGETLRTRTRQQTVGDALAEQGVAVVGMDRVTPSMLEPVADSVEIRVTRVQEAIEVEQDVIGFETMLSPDDDLEIDRQQVAVQGAEGITNWRYRVMYEDGQQVSRSLQDTWVAQDPVDRVIAYGRKTVVRELNTPSGPVEYWRKIRMLATSYSASTAGVSPSNPYFGYTRMGIKMRHGLVAVDPRVVPLGSSVYVPGYGIGFAADTGSAILNRRIDLGYDDDNLVLWYQWVDVYVLAPAPPVYQIRWILPNWPREP